MGSILKCYHYYLTHKILDIVEINFNSTQLRLKVPGYPASEEWIIRGAVKDISKNLKFMDALMIGGS